MPRILVLAALLTAAPVSEAVPRPGHAEQAAQNAFVGGGDLMPRVSKPVVPTDPGDGVPAGALQVEITVNSSGRLVHARIARALDPTGLYDQACLDAMADWQFTPAITPGGQRLSTVVLAVFEVSAPDANRRRQVRFSLAELPQAPLTQTEFADATDSRRLGPGGTQPKVVRMVQPRYTSDAIRAKVQGEVELQIVVLPDGTVGASRVTKSLEPGLDRAALLAARYWLFEPARLNGQPVAVSATLLLEFRLH